MRKEDSRIDEIFETDVKVKIDIEATCSVVYPKEATN